MAFSPEVEMNLMELLEAVLTRQSDGKALARFLEDCWERHAGNAASSMARYSWHLRQNMCELYYDIALIWDEDGRAFFYRVSRPEGSPGQKRSTRSGILFNLRIPCDDNCDFSGVEILWVAEIRS